MDLPPRFLGFPDYETIDPSQLGNLPWAADCDTAVLDIGTFGEVALFHRRSRTLVLTDSLVAVPEDPPALLLDPEYRKALCYHARDVGDGELQDTAEVRRRGWARIALFANFFSPGALGSGEVTVPETGSTRPWTWQAGWRASFERLRNNGRPFVAPIIRDLILRQQPEAARAYVKRLSSWNFTRVVPAHFACPISLTPRELVSAFAFLEGDSGPKYCTEDLAFISDLQRQAIPNGQPVRAGVPCSYMARQ